MAQIPKKYIKQALIDLVVLAYQYREAADKKPNQAHFYWKAVPEQMNTIMFAVGKQGKAVRNALYALNEMGEALYEGRKHKGFVRDVKREVKRRIDTFIRVYA